MITNLPTQPVEHTPVLVTLIDYDRAVDALDRALAAAAAARRQLDQAKQEMDIAEARRIIAGVDGKNETERKAVLLLALLQDGHYRDAEQRACEAAEDLRQAERLVQVQRERCRWYRTALALRGEPAD